MHYLCCTSWVILFRQPEMVVTTRSVKLSLSHTQTHLHQKNDLWFKSHASLKPTCAWFVYLSLVNLVIHPCRSHTALQTVTWPALPGALSQHLPTKPQTGACLPVSWWVGCWIVFLYLVPIETCQTNLWGAPRPCPLLIVPPSGTEWTENCNRSFIVSCQNWLNKGCTMHE